MEPETALPRFVFSPIRMALTEQGLVHEDNADYSRQLQAMKYITHPQPVGVAGTLSFAVTRARCHGDAGIARPKRTRERAPSIVPSAGRRLVSHQVTRQGCPGTAKGIIRRIDSAKFSPVTATSVVAVIIFICACWDLAHFNSILPAPSLF